MVLFRRDEDGQDQVHQREVRGQREVRLRWFGHRGRREYMSRRRPRGRAEEVYGCREGGLRARSRGRRHSRRLSASKTFQLKSTMTRAGLVYSQMCLEPVFVAQDFCEWDSLRSP